MITHENAMKAFHFDPFAAMGGRDKCTVKALRANAINVDTTERSLPGAKVSKASGRGGRVTIADVSSLFKNVEKDKKAGEKTAGRY
jgi:hypothetical protein